MNESSLPELGFQYRYVPAKSAAAAPTLLLLHGTGGTENDLLSIGRSLSPESALLSPRGKISENGMPRFFRRLAEGVFDLEDLQKRTHELADFVQKASQNYSLDDSKILAVGYSNGANIAASTLLLRPQTLAGAVLLHPMVPLVPEVTPDLGGKIIFIGAGRYDPIVEPSQTEQLATMLREAGADVEVFWQNNGHNITQDELLAAQNWLQKRVHAL